MCACSAFFYLQLLQSVNLHICTYFSPRRYVHIFAHYNSFLLLHIHMHKQTHTHTFTSRLLCQCLPTTSVTHSASQTNQMYTILFISIHFTWLMRLKAHNNNRRRNEKEEVKEKRFVFTHVSLKKCPQNNNHAQRRALHEPN